MPLRPCCSRSSRETTDFPADAGKLIVDPQTHTASGVILITNQGDEAKVLLMADDFVADGKGVGMGAKVLFGANDEVPAKGELPLTVPANGHARVRIDVSKLAHAGIARSRP